MDPDDAFLANVTSTMQQKVEELLGEESGLVENISVILKTIGEVAVSLSDGHDKDRACAVRDEFKEIMIQGEEACVHKAAMEDLSSEYSCPRDVKPTDFQKWIHDKMQDLKETRGFNPEAEQEYVMLCQDLCDGDGVHGAQIVPESDDDAMVIEDSNVAPNTTCPLSGKNIFELAEPVEDRRGFVYERAVIEAMLRSQPTNSAMCPVAGTNHTVQLTDLKTARKVLREKKRRERAPNAVLNNDSEVL